MHLRKYPDIYHYSGKELNRINIARDHWAFVMPSPCLDQSEKETFCLFWGGVPYRMSRYFQIPFFILAYLSPWGEDTFACDAFLLSIYPPSEREFCRTLCIKTIVLLIPTWKEKTLTLSDTYVTEDSTPYVEYTKTWQFSEDKYCTGQATIFFWYV